MASRHALGIFVVSSSRQELPVAVGAPQELVVGILWVHGLCSQGGVWSFVPDYALTPNSEVLQTWLQLLQSGFRGSLICWLHSWQLQWRKSVSILWVFRKACSSTEPWWKECWHSTVPVVWLASAFHHTATLLQRDMWESGCASALCFLPQVRLWSSFCGTKPTPAKFAWGRIFFFFICIHRYIFLHIFFSSSLSYKLLWSLKCSF